MKALSLIQPWASLIAFGEKRIETRSWSTSYRGPIAIHASKRTPRTEREFVNGDPFFGAALARHNVRLDDLPLGCVVAIAQLRWCIPIDEDTAHRIELTEEYPIHEVEFGNYAPGRFAWVLTDVQDLADPVTAKGSLGLWEWTRP